MRALLLGLVFAANCFCYQRVYGWCETGAKTVLTGAQQSVTNVQVSYPACTVTVYVTGTLTKAVLFSDNNGTALANPFKASNNGYWFFYAANGRYDISTQGGTMTGGRGSATGGGPLNSVLMGQGATTNAAYVTLPACSTPGFSLTYSLTTGWGCAFTSTGGGASNTVLMGVGGSGTAFTSIPNCASGVPPQYSYGSGTWSCATPQGNGTKLQMAGTNSGVAGTGLCNDAGGNATDSGCTSVLPTPSAQLQYLRTKPNAGNNTTLQFAALPVVNAADYVYPAQTPGGSLAGGGGAATINLTPCPVGIYSGTLWSPVLISGGTGTQEALTPSGGTCTSGATTGTIIVSPNNSHTGAWTVSSATNGIQEAEAVIKTTGGTISLAAGVFTQCGTVTIDTDGIVIAGAGSGGTGPIQSDGVGAAGTLLQPCSANQVLFNAPNGHGYGGAGTTGSTVAQLSMHDIGFRNNGLAGATAIKLLHDTSGIYTNLNFAGTTNAFYGIYCDRCWGTQVSNITSSGTEGSFFGSTVDVGTEVWAYATAVITNWTHDGPGASIPVMVWQRCVGCKLSHSNFWDEGLTVTGTGLQILNDSQGNSVEDVVFEGYLAGISVASNTVAATTAAPGWTTISDYQFDCAGGAGCLSNTPVALSLGSGSFETGVINPTFTAVTTTGVAIAATGVVSGHNVARIVGGLFDFTQPASQLVLTGPITGVQVVGNTFETSTPGSSVFLNGSGAATSIVITGNLMTGSTTAPVSLIGPTLVSSYIAQNVCPTDGFGYCTGGLAPTLQRDSAAVAFSTLPACATATSGARATVNNSNTVVWGAGIAGGGGSTVLAFCNGASWTVAGK